MELDVPRSHVPRPSSDPSEVAMHAASVPADALAAQCRADAALVEANRALMRRLQEFVAANDANVDLAEAALRQARAELGECLKHSSLGPSPAHAQPHHDRGQQPPSPTRVGTKRPDNDAAGGPAVGVRPGWIPGTSSSTYSVRDTLC